MNAKEFNNLLSDIELNLTGKKPVMTIYSKSYIFKHETKEKMEGLQINIINKSVYVCLFVGYDLIPDKYGFKYETLRDLYNRHYSLTYKQLDKLISKLSEYTE